MSSIHVLGMIESVSTTWVSSEFRLADAQATRVMVYFI